MGPYRTDRSRSPTGGRSEWVSRQVATFARHKAKLLHLSQPFSSGTKAGMILMTLMRIALVLVIVIVIAMVMSMVIAIQTLTIVQVADIAAVVVIVKGP